MRLAALAGLLALAGCDSEPAGEPGGTASPAAADPQAPAGEDAIPLALRGRWGLTAADCAPGRADAEGLLAIGPETLEFYESVGTLEEVGEAGPGSVRAAFAFTGEGMEWEREIALALEDGGATLVRREFGEDAAIEPFRYQRCEGEGG